MVSFMQRGPGVFKIMTAKCMSGKLFNSIHGQPLAYEHPWVVPGGGGYNLRSETSLSTIHKVNCKLPPNYFKMFQ